MCGTEKKGILLRYRKMVNHICIFQFAELSLHENSKKIVIIQLVDGVIFITLFIRVKKQQHCCDNYPQPALA